MQDIHKAMERLRQFEKDNMDWSADTRHVFVPIVTVSITIYQ